MFPLNPPPVVDAGAQGDRGYRIHPPIALVASPLCASLRRRVFFGSCALFPYFPVLESPHLESEWSQNGQLGVQSEGF